MRVNLKEIFGVSFAGQDALKEALAQAILDKILDNSKSGVDRRGVPFKKYSKAYKKSDDYKAYGKTSKVNLTLTGDMLGLLNVTEKKGNTVTLGWEEPDEGLKAHGHITGGGKLPKRDFFGINSKALKDVKDEFDTEIKEIIKAKESKDLDAFGAAALALIKRVEDGQG